MNYKNITVAGSGVFGSQIAFQTAYKGFHVNVYDISDQVLAQAKERLTKLRDNYEAFSRISVYADLTFQITLRRYADSIFKASLWGLQFCGPLGFSSNSREIDGSRYSSSRASFVVRALRIMPMFIGLSLLLLFDFGLRDH
jgi:hypothetical protein